MTGTELVEDVYRAENERLRLALKDAVATSEEYRKKYVAVMEILASVPHIRAWADT